MKKLSLIPLLAIISAIGLGMGVAPGVNNATPASAHEPGAPDPNGVVMEDVHAVLPFVFVPYAVADELVPPGYTVKAVDNPETPLVDESRANTPDNPETPTGGRKPAEYS